MTGGILAALAAGFPWAVALTASAFAMGAVLGAGLCALRVSSVPLLRVPAAAVTLALQSIPPILWLFLVVLTRGTGIVAVGPFAAAAIGLALITGANMAEIYRGALAAIHPGQREAAAMLGLPARSRMVDVIGPQLLRAALPSAAGLALGLLKDTAVASTIGVGEIAFQDASQRTAQGPGAFAVAGALYIALSLPIAVATRWADLRVRGMAAR